MNQRTLLPISLIVIVYLIIGALYASYTPDWQAPDEPAHYNYVRQLADGRFPIIEPGDYDQDYIVTAVFENQFAPQYPIEPLSYEDWQPPLYYLLQTPVFWVSGGQLVAMRLFSLLLGTGIIILAYASAQTIFPEKEWLALTTAVFVAFVPQHIAIMAALNNDSLAELIIAAVLLLLLQLATHQSPIPNPKSQIPTPKLLLIGLLMGLGFLTKGTVYPLTLLVALVVLGRFWGDWRAFFRAGLLIAIPAALLGSIWWGRNIIVYGGLDILGKAAHDAVVVGQPRTADWVAEMGLLEVVKRFIETTFNSFWGQFGWMTVPMPIWTYRLLWLLTGLVIVGLLRHLLTPTPNTKHQALSEIPNLKSRIFNPHFLILLGLFLLTLSVHIGYNLTFVQHQGRYLFPALVPIGLAVSVGLGVWLRPLNGRYPRIQYLIPLGLGVWLIALALFALFRVIVPSFA